MTEQDYIKGKNCLRDLYNSLNIEGYEEKNDDNYSNINEVKELVFSNFKNVEIIDDKIDREKGREITEKLLNKGYNVARGILMAEELSCKVDIIENTAYGINTYIIDVSSRISERSLAKCEFIKYICEKLNINIDKMIVININTKYIREEKLNLNELFRGRSVEVEVNNDIEKNILEIKSVLEKNKKYPCNLETKCIKGDKCNGLGICFNDVKNAEIFTIDGKSISNEKKIEYFKKGIRSFKEIKENITLKKNLKIMIDAAINNVEYINKKEIEKFLKKIEKYPMYFLDFETFQEPIPKYKGRKGYMQIPFQYSLHILQEDGTLTHKEFLGEIDEDTTRSFSKRLIKDIKKDDGVIIAYNMTFEKGVVKNMIEIHTDLRKDLEYIKEKFLDIMIPFKEKHFYKKEMEFSYSIKKVLPALCKTEISYDNLNIKNGAMAMNTFPNLHKKSEEERKELRNDLLEYCKLDTLAMVKIYEKLKEVIK